jgi:hypothetical protein
MIQWVLVGAQLEVEIKEGEPRFKCDSPICVICDAVTIRSLYKPSHASNEMHCDQLRSGICPERNQKETPKSYAASASVGTVARLGSIKQTPD